jgi:phosphoglycolate phosphatase
MLQSYTIAFDLDGTLVDTAPDLVRATNEIMDILGLAHVDVADMRKIVGRGAKASIERAAALSERAIDDDEMARLLPIFLETYRKGIAISSRAYDGAREAIELLKAAGAKLVICTNKPTHLAKLVLSELAILDYFQDVYGPESTPKTKPDPIHLITAIEGCGGDISRAILIGDSENDVLAAQNASIPVVVTSFGYTMTKAPDLGADAFFDHYDELFELIISVLKLNN